LHRHCMKNSKARVSARTRALRDSATGRRLYERCGLGAQLLAVAARHAGDDGGRYRRG
jgi:hypothetical protein